MMRRALIFCLLLLAGIAAADARLVVNQLTGFGVAKIGDQQLVALWNFDGTNGQTGGSVLEDSSLGGASHALSANGNAQADTAITVDSVPGNSGFNSSTLLDGTGDSYHVVTVNPPDLEFGTGNFTIHGWIYRNGTQTNFAGVYRSANVTIDIPTGSNSQLRLYIISLGLILTGNAVPNQTWQHFAAVRNGDRFDLYQDGVSTANGTQSGSLGAANTVMIGENNTNYWNGNIDAIAVYKGRAIWTSNFTRPTSPPNPMTPP